MLFGTFTWAATHPAAACAILLMLPLIADGVIQLCTSYESNNYRRLWTGVLFGYGLMDLVFLSAGWMLKWGYCVGVGLKV